MGNNTDTNGWARVLKDKRLELGETQTVFGARFGVGAVAVSLWESGKRDVPSDVAWWLTKNALNIDDDGNFLDEVVA